MTRSPHRGGLAPVVLALLLGAGSAGAAVSVIRYSAGPPVAHTGGFGEPTCTECHADQPPDSARVAFGAPATWEPGTTYRLTVRLERQALRRAGFQLSARFADGTQAGMLKALDARVQVTPDSTTGVLYASHTSDGAAARSGVAEWSLAWTAPRSGGDVDFHIAANASNDDFSEFGDVIVTAYRRAAREGKRPDGVSPDGAPAGGS